MVDYDAIVCGGGPNGLAAAIRLAEAGWSVCLLEANDEVGGAARTIESTLPGFRHDFGAAFFPLVGAAPSVVGRDLAPYGLRFVHAPLPAAHPFPGNRRSRSAVPRPRRAPRSTRSTSATGRYGSRSTRPSGR
jgi:phytoene dehydrogenase-like protein